MAIAVLFPGQGTQTPRMGADTFSEVGPGNALTGLAKRTVDATVTVPTNALLEVA